MRKVIMNHVHRKETDTTLKIGLITFAAITLTISSYTGVHQWNVQGRDLIFVVKVGNLASLRDIC